MEKEKNDLIKIEIYKFLKEQYPNLKDTTLMLIIESSLNLIAGVNEEITFPIETLSNYKIYDKDNFDYKWNITTDHYGRL